MTYAEQLQQEEWKDLREKILERDDYECQECGAKKSEFLMMSSEFGIKTLNEMEEFGYDVSICDDGIIEIFNGDNGFVNEVTNISGSNIDLESLNFALKFSNSKTPKFICFTTEDYENDDKKILHIHHKYYIKGRLAWEYKPEALICLCHDCHEEVHTNEIIKIYHNASLDTFKESQKCFKCSGSGYLPQYDYYLNGVCFNCWGAGIEINILER